MIFSDRTDAGKQLAKALDKYAGGRDTVVLGLPRGGVVVAYEVARKLGLPLDIICPRKIGAPFNPELAIGAVTETGEGLYNEYLLDELRIPDEYLQKKIKEETEVAQRRLKLFRKNKPPRQVVGKTVILVDDGIATGATMKAAIHTLKLEGASKIIAAVPIGPADTIGEMEQLADEVVCLDSPSFFQAIGQFYNDFTQVEDEEVIDILNKGVEYGKSNQ